MVPWLNSSFFQILVLWYLNHKTRVFPISRRGLMTTVFVYFYFLFLAAPRGTWNFADRSHSGLWKNRASFQIFESRKHLELQAWRSCDCSDLGLAERPSPPGLYTSDGPRDLLHSVTQAEPTPSRCLSIRMQSVKRKVLSLWTHSTGLKSWLTCCHFLGKALALSEPHILFYKTGVREEESPSWGLLCELNERMHNINAWCKWPTTPKVDLIAGRWC